MFSPYYHWAGRREPENHICLNVALYGPRKRWSMTERGRSALERGPDLFRIGPSALRWEDDGLTVEVCERAVPHLTPVRGRVRITPQTLNARGFALDDPGRHVWRPIAPTARVEAAFSSPAQSWSGQAYVDTNYGAEPLEAGFRRWDWSRWTLASGRGAILYDVERREGARRSLGLRFGLDGGVEELEPPARAPLPGTLWRVKRGLQSDNPSAIRERRRLEDAPFYARAEMESRLFGEAAHGVHETVDADRFASRWVKLLLPWRMPRAFA